jgi:hypothetical protein
LIIHRQHKDTKGHGSARIGEPLAPYIVRKVPPQHLVAHCKAAARALQKLLSEMGGLKLAPHARHVHPSTPHLNLLISRFDRVAVHASRRVFEKLAVVHSLVFAAHHLGYVVHRCACVRENGATWSNPMRHAKTWRGHASMGVIIEVAYHIKYYCTRARGKCDTIASRFCPHLFGFRMVQLIAPYTFDYLVVAPAANKIDR